MTPSIKALYTLIVQNHQKLVQDYNPKDWIIVLEKQIKIQQDLIRLIKEHVDADHD